MFSGAEKTRACVSSKGAPCSSGVAARYVLLVTLLALTSCVGSGCRKPWGKQSVRPRSLRDVPAERLAYRFEADTNAPPTTGQGVDEKLQSIQNDFDTR